MRQCLRRKIKSFDLISSANFTQSIITFQENVHKGIDERVRFYFHLLLQDLDPEVDRGKGDDRTVLIIIIARITMLFWIRNEKFSNYEQSVISAKKFSNIEITLRCVTTAQSCGIQSLDFKKNVSVKRSVIIKIWPIRKIIHCYLKCHHSNRCFHK